jgi:hypothetical protein
MKRAHPPGSPACKDCRAAGVTTIRATPHPGPRCVTHHRAWKRGQRARTASKRVERVYGIPPAAYEALRAVQGGLCAGCGPRSGRNGSTKRLAVDHDHRCAAGHDPKRGCPQCVRGLLCSTCNQVIGAFRDDPLTLLRLANYLLNPPGRGVLAAFDYDCLSD